MHKFEPVDVSIVVPCRNEISHIGKFLDSVFLQRSDGINLEVVIADGMSDDGTRQVLCRYEQTREGMLPVLRVIDNRGKIASTGLNAAIRVANGEVIVRMDVHSEYAPDYVSNCVHVLKETGAENVGGPALTRADGDLAQAIALSFHSRFACGGARFRDPQYEGYVDTVPYGCWRKSTLSRIGFFDEHLCRSQDGDLNLRLISAGGKIWQSPKIISWYRPRGTLRALFRQYFQYGFWKMSVIRKHRRPAAWRNLIPSVCVVTAILLFLLGAGARIAGFPCLKSVFLHSEIVLAGLYCAASFSAAISIAHRNGWRFMPFLPIVFATYHLSYGLGSLLALTRQPNGDRSSYVMELLTTSAR